MNYFIVPGILMLMAFMASFLFWKFRNSGRDILLYFVASSALLLVTGAILFMTPVLYNWMGGTSFIPPSQGEGIFDGQTYSGYLQVLFGVPLAVAGSVYAILLARQSERQTRQFNIYEIKKNFNEKIQQRNATLHRYADALRDINNASYILRGQVDKVFTCLPDNKTTSSFEVKNIAAASQDIDSHGLNVLRQALQDYRNALTALDQAKIELDKSDRLPLSAIQAHFYPKDENDRFKNAQPFTVSCLERDYGTVADRFIVCSQRLSAKDLIQTRIEALVDWIAKQSEKEEYASSFELRSWLYDWINDEGGITGSDVDDLDDDLGFRWIGSLLIRTNNAKEEIDLLHDSNFYTLYRIELGTALLFDSCLALPGAKQTAWEIIGWPEWSSLTDVTEGAGEAPVLRNYARNSQKMLPGGFFSHIRGIQGLYKYLNESSDAKEDNDAKRQARISLLDHRSLFAPAPAISLTQYIRKLASSILDAEPIGKKELIESLSAGALALLTSRLDASEGKLLDAIDRIMRSIGWEVLDKYPAGDPQGLRRILLSLRGKNDEKYQDEIIIRLQSLVNNLKNSIEHLQLVIQIHMDLCFLKVHSGEQAAADDYLQKARVLLFAMSDESFRKTPWFMKYSEAEGNLSINREILLFCYYLHSIFAGAELSTRYSKNYISPIEVAMPIGFCSIIWLYLEKKGAVVSTTNNTLKLKKIDEGTFFGVVIDSSASDWSWNPLGIWIELSEIKRQSTNSLLDQIYNNYCHSQ